MGVVTTADALPIDLAVHQEGASTDRRGRDPVVLSEIGDLMQVRGGTLTLARD